MIYKIDKVYRHNYILVLCLLAFSCNNSVKETTSEKSVVLPNGIHLTVVKTNKYRTSVGILTNTNYGTTHSYKYNVLLNEPNINWSYGSGEPKNLLFCKDTTYIHYVNKNSYPIKVTDSITNTITTKYTHKVENMYQKYIDKRYFFNLFGDDFWLDITPERYNKIKNLCSEYVIPNDNELTLSQE